MANELGIPNTVSGRLLLLIRLTVALLLGALMRKEDSWRRRQRTHLALALVRLSRDVFRLALLVMPARGSAAAGAGGKAILSLRDEIHDFGA